MRLTVLNVAYPLAPAGPDAPGGAEQVLTLLDRALVRKGHTSIVVACEGSRATGDLIEIPRVPAPSTTRPGGRRKRTRGRRSGGRWRGGRSM
jgi:hypothetical protein